MTKITQKSFIKALDKSGGNQSTIAQRLEVTRGAVTLFLNKNPKMKELCETEGERIIDVAENVIDSSITKDRDLDSSKWKLLHSKRGKARGYGPKTELEHSGEINSTTINLIEKSVEEIKREKSTGQPSQPSQPDNKPETNRDSQSTE